MIVYHICEIESSLEQGKFPEEGRNILVYYKCFLSPTKQLNRLNYHISAIAFTNHVVPWLVKVSLSHSQKQYCVLSYDLCAVVCSPSTNWYCVSKYTEI